MKVSILLLFIFSINSFPQWPESIFTHQSIFDQTILEQKRYFTQLNEQYGVVKNENQYDYYTSNSIPFFSIRIDKENKEGGLLETISYFKRGRSAGVIEIFRKGEGIKFHSDEKLLFFKINFSNNLNLFQMRINSNFFSVNYHKKEKGKFTRYTLDSLTNFFVDEYDEEFRSTRLIRYMCPVCNGEPVKVVIFKPLNETPFLKYYVSQNQDEADPVLFNKYLNVFYLPGLIRSFNRSFMSLKNKHDWPIF